MKHCLRCDSDKPEEAFTRDKTRPDGLFPYCRECTRARSRTYRQENLAAVRENDRKYWKTNRETRQRNSRKFYDANRELVLERSAKWHRENRDATNAAGKRWRERHPEAFRESMRKHRRKREGANPTPVAVEYMRILDGDPCAYCGAPPEEMDHIDPVALGGDGEWHNFTAACTSCNRRKSDKPLLAFLAYRLAI